MNTKTCIVLVFGLSLALTVFKSDGFSIGDSQGRVSSGGQTLDQVQHNRQREKQHEQQQQQQQQEVTNTTTAAAAEIASINDVTGVPERDSTSIGNSNGQHPQQTANANKGTRLSLLSSFLPSGKSLDGSLTDFLLRKFLHKDSKDGDAGKTESSFYKTANDTVVAKSNSSNGQHQEDISSSPPEQRQMDVEPTHNAPRDVFPKENVASKGGTKNETMTSVAPVEMTNDRNIGSNEGNASEAMSLNLKNDEGHHTTASNSLNTETTTKSAVKLNETKIAYSSNEEGGGRLKNDSGDLGVPLMKTVDDRKDETVTNGTQHTQTLSNNTNTDTDTDTDINTDTDEDKGKDRVSNGTNTSNVDRQIIGTSETVSISDNLKEQLDGENAKEQQEDNINMQTHNAIDHEGNTQNYQAGVGNKEHNQHSQGIGHKDALKTFDDNDRQEKIQIAASNTKPSHRTYISDLERPNDTRTYDLKIQTILSSQTERQVVSDVETGTDDSNKALADNRYSKSFSNQSVNHREDDMSNVKTNSIGKVDESNGTTLDAGDRVNDTSQDEGSNQIPYNTSDELNSTLKKSQHESQLVDANVKEIIKTNDTNLKLNKSEQGNGEQESKTSLIILKADNFSNIEIVNEPNLKFDKRTFYHQPPKEQDTKLPSENTITVNGADVGEMNGSHITERPNEVSMGNDSVDEVTLLTSQATLEPNRLSTQDSTEESFVPLTTSPLMTSSETKSRTEADDHSPTESTQSGLPVSDNSMTSSKMKSSTEADDHSPTESTTQSGLPVSDNLRTSKEMPSTHPPVPVKFIAKVASRSDTHDLDPSPSQPTSGNKTTEDDVIKTTKEHTAPLSNNFSFNSNVDSNKSNPNEVYTQPTTQQEEIILQNEPQSYTQRQNRDYDDIMQATTRNLIILPTTEGTRAESTTKHSSSSESVINESKVIQKIDVEKDHEPKSTMQSNDMHMEKIDTEYLSPLQEKVKSKTKDSEIKTGNQPFNNPARTSKPTSESRHSQHSQTNAQVISNTDDDEDDEETLNIALTSQKPDEEPPKKVDLSRNYRYTVPYYSLVRRDIQANRARRPSKLRVRERKRKPSVESPFQMNSEEQQWIKYAELKRHGIGRVIKDRTIESDPKPAPYSLLHTIPKPLRKNPSYFEHRRKSEVPSSTVTHAPLNSWLARMSGRTLGGDTFSSRSRYQQRTHKEILFGRSQGLLNTDNSNERLESLVNTNTRSKAMSDKLHRSWPSITAQRGNKRKAILDYQRDRTTVKDDDGDVNIISGLSPSKYNSHPNNPIKENNDDDDDDNDDDDDDDDKSTTRYPYVDYTSTQINQAPSTKSPSPLTHQQSSEASVRSTHVKKQTVGSKGHHDFSEQTTKTPRVQRLIITRLSNDKNRTLSNKTLPAIQRLNTNEKTTPATTLAKVQDTTMRFRADAESTTTTQTGPPAADGLQESGLKGSNSQQNNNNNFLPIGIMISEADLVTPEVLQEPTRTNNNNKSFEPSTEDRKQQEEGKTASFVTNNSKPKFETDTEEILSPVVHNNQDSIPHSLIVPEKSMKSPRQVIYKTSVHIPPSVNDEKEIQPPAPRHFDSSWDSYSSTRNEKKAFDLESGKQHIFHSPHPNPRNVRRGVSLGHPRPVSLGHSGPGITRVETFKPGPTSGSLRRPYRDGRDVTHGDGGDTLRQRGNSREKPASFRGGHAKTNLAQSSNKRQGSGIQHSSRSGDNDGKIKHNYDNAHNRQRSASDTHGTGLYKNKGKGSKTNTPVLLNHGQSEIPRSSTESKISIPSGSNSHQNHKRQTHSTSRNRGLHSNIRVGNDFENPAPSADNRDPQTIISSQNPDGSYRNFIQNTDINTDQTIKGYQTIEGGGSSESLNRRFTSKTDTSPESNKETQNSTAESDFNPYDISLSTIDEYAPYPVMDTPHYPIQPVYPYVNPYPFYNPYLTYPVMPSNPYMFPGYQPTYGQFGQFAQFPYQADDSLLWSIINGDTNTQNNYNRDADTQNNYNRDADTQNNYHRGADTQNNYHRNTDTQNNFNPDETRNDQAPTNPKESKANPKIERNSRTSNSRDEVTFDSSSTLPSGNGGSSRRDEYSHTSRTIVKGDADEKQTQRDTIETQRGSRNSRPSPYSLGTDEISPAVDFQPNQRQQPNRQANYWYQPRQSQKYPSNNIAYQPRQHKVYPTSMPYQPRQTLKYPNTNSYQPRQTLKYPNTNSYQPMTNPNRGNPYYTNNNINNRQFNGYRNPNIVPLPSYPMTTGWLPMYPPPMYIPPPPQPHPQPQPPQHFYNNRQPVYWRPSNRQYNGPYNTMDQKDIDAVMNFVVSKNGYRSWTGGRSNSNSNYYNKNKSNSGTGYRPGSGFNTRVSNGRISDMDLKAVEHYIYTNPYFHKKQLGQKTYR